MTQEDIVEMRDKHCPYYLCVNRDEIFYLKKIEKLEAEIKQRKKKTAHNSDYVKCLDELWEHIKLNAKNGSFMKSSIAKILKKYFV